MDVGCANEPAKMRDQGRDCNNAVHIVIPTVLSLVRRIPDLRLIKKIRNEKLSVMIFPVSRL